jgi:hypothetical protein
MTASVTLTDTDRAATLTAAFARPTRGGYTEPDDPPTPPEPTFVRAARQSDPRGAVDAPEWLRPPSVTLPTGEIVAVEDAEAVFQMLADGVETEHAAIWKQADLAAWMFSQGLTRASRAALLGKLVEQAGKTRRTWYRYVAIARTFPPDYRYPDVALNTYLTALTADEPLDALQAAVSYGWTARQLAEHIVTGDTPDERVSLLDDVYDAQDDPEQAAAVIMALWAAALANGAATLRLRFDYTKPGVAA